MFNKVIQRGRKQEFRARNEKYYARNNHPNFHQFKVPEFIDEEGRWYRVAPDQPDKRHVRLWVKLPSKDIQWYKGPRSVVKLDDERVLVIRSQFIENTYTHRTGHVDVLASEWGSL